MTVLRNLRSPSLLQILQAMALVVSTAALLSLGAACTPQVGDACETNQQCNTGAICDTTAPDGYCTLTPCTQNNCPEESSCIAFENEETFCMLRCEDDGDCRTGYACRFDRGPIGFCYIE